MGDSRIKDISSLLSSFFDEDKLRRGERYSDFFSSWPSFAGARLAAHSRVADVDKGLLIVEADHPGWIQLLQMRQSAILEEVAGRFPELGLRGIVFRVRADAAPAERATLGQQAAGGPAGGEEGEDAIAEATPDSATVEDPEFRALFDSLKRTLRDQG